MSHCLVQHNMCDLLSGRIKCENQCPSPALAPNCCSTGQMQTTGFKVNEQRRQRNDKAQDCKGHEVRQATFTADTRSLFGVTDTWDRPFTKHISGRSAVIRTWPYACVHAKSLQLCPTLCKPMDLSPPGSSVYGILQGRILEWVALPSSRGSSSPRD